MNPMIEKLLKRCNTTALREAAIKCLASGMTVQEILDLLDSLKEKP